MTRKEDEEGSRIKARICLQGHLDPDFHKKIESGDCHSPTLSQLGRSLMLQLLGSHHWTMNLGDIKGAFLEAGPLPERYRPLYMHMPQGGIPDVPPDAVVEVVGNLYGANDAPAQWHQAFDKAARDVGFQRSAFDNCLYYLRDSINHLKGILGAHVDDTMCGGEGSEYKLAIEQLRARFPYRKSRVGSGEFCGVQYTLCPESFEITFHQSDYARHLRPIALSKDRCQSKQQEACPKEVTALRAFAGAANWLSGQTRPDLAVQTSFAQQVFPKPTVSDLVYANQLVQRAKQYASVAITVRDIPVSALAIAFHSDARLANASQHRTQAGYILALVNSCLDRDEESAWSPFMWRSYKMPRVVASTLAGEAQSFVTASGTAEWMSLMLAEARTGVFDLRSASGMIKQTPSIGITDCKSLYDAIHTPSSPAKAEDKRVAIDLAIIKQCVQRTGLRTRWVPTELMLADSLTKDHVEPADCTADTNCHQRLLSWPRRKRCARSESSDSSR